MYSGRCLIAWVSVLIISFYVVSGGDSGWHNIFLTPIYVTQFGYKY